jgi:hypothetical protein
MKLRSISLTLAAFLLGGSIANADILILKNGDKKEGNILEERPDAIRMKYRITPKIWDEKDFPREEIQQVIKQKPEEVKILEMRKVLPTPDLLTADQYEQIVQDRLRPFINEFPGTEQAKEVEEMLKVVQGEKEKVVNGQLKMEGKWLTAEDVKRDDYDIQAFKVRRTMLTKAAEQDFNGSLREFDRLGNAENGYPASLNYVKAIPEAIDIMTKYESLLTRMLAEQPVFQKQRDESLKRAVEPSDQARTQAAIKREMDLWKATYDAEKKSNMRWLTQYKYDAKAMQEQLKVLLTERGKLQLMDMARLQTQNEALTKAMRYLSDGNILEAETALSSAQASSVKDSSRVISQIRLQLGTLKSEQAKAKIANRAIGAGSSAVAGSSAAIQDDKVAQIMAEAEKEREAKKAGGTPPAGSDGKSETKADTKAPGATKSDAKTAAKPATAPKVMLPIPVEEEEGLGTQTYLLIGAALLIVILLATLLKQRKAAK